LTNFLRLRLGWKCNYDKVTHLFYSSSRTGKFASNRSEPLSFRIGLLGNFDANARLWLCEIGIHPSGGICHRVETAASPAMSAIPDNDQAPQHSEMTRCANIYLHYAPNLRAAR
jgi:hypothetical protein